jgi:ferric-dicitrate binding protein FerR (iron transport regulator)
MHRGELSVLDINSRAVETSKVNASLYNSWIDGVYFFDTQSLEEIMNDMGRYYSLDVVFLNGSMKNKVLSGRLHIEDNAGDHVGII